MRALLTGSTGFVGQNLLHYLRQQGWQLEIIGRHDSMKDMDQKMADFKPNVVIHLATLFKAEHQSGDIPSLIQSNITFGTQVVEAMVRHKVLNLVNTGTLWQYYEGQREVPACLYAATKTAFESILRFYSSAHQLSVLNLMLSDSFGPKDPRGKLLPKLLSIAGTEEKLQLSAGQQVIEWTFISDIVEAFEVAAKRLILGQEPKKFVSYTAASGEAYSLRESVSLCEKVLSKKIAIDFGAKPYRQREVMSPQKLDPQLPGWSAKVSFIQGIEACLHE
ncbi:MAG TPA: NAD(P)-dependent oxidoreductase [Pseudobdellovibrionaceae bacterium]|jgi:nucleoside-diphosphate-sugar epimerase